MTTLAQFLFSQRPDKSLDFEKFKEHLISTGVVSEDLVDSNYPIKSNKKEVTTSRSINREAHRLFRKKLGEKTKLTDIIQFLICKLSQAIEESGNTKPQDLIEEWDKRLTPTLSTKSPEDRIKIFLEILAKLITLGGDGSKTLSNYLRVKSNKLSESENKEEELPFLLGKGNDES